MRAIKELLCALAADSGWKAMTGKQRMIAVYMGVSFVLIFTCNLLVIIVALCNLLNAVRLADKYGLDKIVEE